MKLIDLLQRAQPPIPWHEGDNIPWNEPAFSTRMLAEHLTQAHDRASRRAPIIDQQVAWIHRDLLHTKPTRILDLGCGPGLYCNRLAALGHACVGIDYSPASIQYAREQARLAKVAATFLHEDIRVATFGKGFGLVMLLFGELNVFSPSDAALILKKAYNALQPGGLLLLEPHTFASLVPSPQASNSWFSSSVGLFSPAPHLVLIEESWNQESSTLTRRYYVIDAVTAEVTRYAQSLQAYSDAHYSQLLNHIGFAGVEIRASLGEGEDVRAPEFQAIIAIRPT